MPDHCLDLILQTAERHVEQQKDARRKEVNKADPESLSVCMTEFHYFRPFTKIIPGLCFSSQMAASMRLQSIIENLSYSCMASPV